MDQISNEQRLNAVNEVEIDEGVFKYVLIRVFANDSVGNEISKLIVRYEVIKY